MEGEEPERALVPSPGPRWGQTAGCKCAVLKQAPSSHPLLDGLPRCRVLPPPGTKHAPK